MATQPTAARPVDEQGAASQPAGFLSFEVEGELLHIIANPAGLARLKRIVEQLGQAASQGVNEDAHLFAESWGGYDLNETSLVPKAITMKQVDFRIRLIAPLPSDAA